MDCWIATALWLPWTDPMAPRSLGCSCKRPRHAKASQHVCVQNRHRSHNGALHVSPGIRITILRLLPVQMSSASPSPSHSGIASCRQHHVMSCPTCLTACSVRAVKNDLALQGPSPASEKFGSAFCSTTCGPPYLTTGSSNCTSRLASASSWAANGGRRTTQQKSCLKHQNKTFVLWYQYLPKSSTT